MAYDVRGAMSPQVVSKLDSNVNPTTQASVASLLNYITYNTTFVSGTAAMTGFAVPKGFKGTFVIIPTAVSTGVTGGAYSSDDTYDYIPIGLAFTNVANKAQMITTDGKLCYPSYTS